MLPNAYPESVPESAKLYGRSAASWGAILTGAVVAVGTSIILLSLGAGFEFASVSPWADRGVSTTTFTITTAIWLIITQWVSALLGGYVTGRLRTRWIGTHVHEVFFRDTAHGLATWCVATILVTAVAGISATSAVSGAFHAAGKVGSAAAMTAGMAADSPRTAYDVDKLFRSSGDAPITVTPDARAEALHIFGHALSADSVSESDRTYLATLIAQKTGITADAAQARVNEFVASVDDAKMHAKAAADAARKSAAETAIYTALALLIGAFIASAAAVLGGRLRDEHV